MSCTFQLSACSSPWQQLMSLNTWKQYSVNMVYPSLLSQIMAHVTAVKYFKEMMKKMGIHHITTSPHHHQSNGLAEGYVRIIKSLLQKAKETGDDPHAVTLIYHSTPLSDTAAITIWNASWSKIQYQTYHKFSTTPPSHLILFIQKTSNRGK